MRTDDECYTGTGPAAEVANGWTSPAPQSDATAHAGKHEPAFLLLVRTPYGDAICPVPKPKPGQPRGMTIAGDTPESGHWYSPEVVRELLAQRDGLAAALECVLRDHLVVHGVGDLEMQPALFQARAALSRIKGA
jgi:hypothetical protein